MLHPRHHLPPFFHLVTSWHPTAPHLEPGTPCPGLWSPPGGQMEWTFLCTRFTFPPSSLWQLVTKNMVFPFCLLLHCKAHLLLLSCFSSPALTSVCWFCFPLVPQKCGCFPGSTLDPVFSFSGAFLECQPFAQD